MEMIRLMQSVFYPYFHYKNLDFITREMEKEKDGMKRVLKEREECTELREKLTNLGCEVEEFIRND